jgi:hypothetical protein
MRYNLIDRERQPVVKLYCVAIANNKINGGETDAETHKASPKQHSRRTPLP